MSTTNHDAPHDMISTVVKGRSGKTVSMRGRDTVTRSPPSDLIIWAQARDWHPKVERLLSDHLTVSVKRRLRGMDTDCFSKDDLEWLEQASGDDSLGYCLGQVLADALHGWRVRTYHACRPRDVLTYLNAGLRCLRAEEAIQDLRRLVDLHPQLSVLRDDNALAAALARVEIDGRTGRVFVGLDDRGLVEGAGHYLIYGSEYLSAVLAQAGGCYFQNVLKIEGIPTVFVIDLPISLMRQSDLRDFARLLLSRWATNLVTGRRTAPDEDYSFDIRCDVPSTCIVGHYHPARIRDPLNRLEPYVSPATSCPACVRPRVFS